MSLLSAFKKIYALRNLPFGEANVISASRLSELLSISVKESHLLLYFAEISGAVTKIYYVRAPFGERRLYGPWEDKDKVPEEIEAQFFDDQNFIVKPEMIEEFYRMEQETNGKVS